MGIYLRGKTWWMCYKLPTGEYIRRSVDTPNRKQAEAIFAKQRTAIAENKHLDVKHESRLVFRELAELYLERHAKPHKRSWKSTDAIYIKHFNRFFGSFWISTVTQQLVERYFAEQRKRVIGTRKDGFLKYLTPATLNRQLTCLKTIFNKAIEWGELSQNPCARIKRSRENNAGTRFLTDEEIGRLYLHASPDLRQIVTVLIHTGMRKGELENLQWANLDFDRSLITLTKTKSGKTRHIPMNQAVKHVLLQRRIDKRNLTWVFPGRDNKKPCDFRSVFEAARIKAGLQDVRIHDLRHTFASQLRMKGVDLMTVKELLGHSSLAMTERYSHVTDRHRSEAVARLEGLPDGTVSQP